MMDPQQQVQTNFSLFDSLFCKEEHWEEEGEESNETQTTEIYNNNNNQSNPSLVSPFLLVEQDFLEREDEEEFLSLLSREQKTHFFFTNLESNLSLESARKEAIDWILRVISHYSFSSLTAILSVNYLDRFLSTLHFQRDKPWMIQLVAVACLSLAAKVEETQVPLLLDLQVEETKYLFEAKTIQKMEILVLSTLQWRMNPVTPLSFFDHILRRLGFKNNFHWEFLQRFEHLLLLIVSDSKFVHYLPSILSTGIILHVIDHFEPDNQIDYKNQLMGVFKISKEEIEDCYEFIKQWISITHCNKRKYPSIPSSPNGVIDVSFSSDRSNESWVVASPPDHHPLLKKTRTSVLEYS